MMLAVSCNGEGGAVVRLTCAFVIAPVERVISDEMRREKSPTRNCFIISSTEKSQASLKHDCVLPNHSRVADINNGLRYISTSDSLIILRIEVSILKTCNLG